MTPGPYGFLKWTLKVAKPQGFCGAVRYWFSSLKLKKTCLVGFNNSIFLFWMKTNYIYFIMLTKKFRNIKYLFITLFMGPGPTSIFITYLHINFGFGTIINALLPLFHLFLYFLIFKNFKLHLYLVKRQEKIDNGLMNFFFVFLTKII